MNLKKILKNWGIQPESTYLWSCKC